MFQYLSIFTEIVVSSSGFVSLYYVSLLLLLYFNVKVSWTLWPPYIIAVLYLDRASSAVHSGTCFWMFIRVFFGKQIVQHNQGFSQNCTSWLNSKRHHFITKVHLSLENYYCYANSFNYIVTHAHCVTMGPVQLLLLSSSEI